MRTTKKSNAVFCDKNGMNGAQTLIKKQERNLERGIDFCLVRAGVRNKEERKGEFSEKSDD